MKRHQISRPALFGMLALLGTTLLIGYLTAGIENENHPPKERFAAAKPDPVQLKIDRNKYFHKILRDPVTGRIPPNVRSLELNFAKNLPDRNQVPMELKTAEGITQQAQFTWNEAGPFDVGGRTRALALDQRNTDIIIAGGVSGGMWKSTDGGTSWTMTSDPNENLSVTSVVQDPTDQDVWYYTTGEFRGQTAADRGSTAPYFGDGIYRSIDNGDSWSLLPNASSDVEGLVSKFNTVSRIRISPTTGSIFIASNGFGIYRSTDDGNSFPSPPVLGSEGEQFWADLDVASTGRVVASISTQTFGSGSFNPGIFYSDDDGENWTEITPQDFPSTHQRSVVKMAPSDPDLLYVLTYVDGEAPNEDIRFFKININTGVAEDYSQNLPDFGGPVGISNTQINYNMEIGVKPDDPDLVLVGMTNLFRSFDGFSTGPSGSSDSEKDEFWVGGYAKANDISQYPGQHPDQHIVVFYPNDPSRVIVGHDGGISRTSDIEATSVSWNNLDDGYVTSQFYAVDIPNGENDNRLVGGTQDNGSLFFEFDVVNGQQGSTSDISSGDGTYSFFTNSFIFVATQRGRIIRWLTDSSGDPVAGQFAFVHPADATGQAFVHPYVVDPSDESIMYYPGQGGTLWRNTSIDDIPQNNDSGGVTSGWEALQVNIGSGFTITTLEVTTTPSNTLYFGASSRNDPPKFFRILGANASSSEEEFDIPAQPGSFFHDIAINPANGSEILAVMSNYNVPSLFHTTDGGENWTEIEGNLGDVNNQTGPSIRSATIIPSESGNVYLLGTSTGVYSTATLDGSNTQWVQEAPGSLGYGVTQFITSRISNGDVAAGTHGRGIFKGTFGGTVADIPSISVNPVRAMAGQEIDITASNFSFSSQITNIEVFFNNTEARITDATSSQLTVVVPRDAIPETTDSDIVQLRVQSGQQNVSTTFEIVPPAEFELGQNFPNPFSSQTSIPLDLSENSGVILQVYDITGRKILERLSPFEGDQSSFAAINPRAYNINIDLTGYASGVYFYRIVTIPADGSSGRIIESKKMTLIKN